MAKYIIAHEAHAKGCRLYLNIFFFALILDTDSCLMLMKAREFDAP